jgi:high-affinity iron transporter
MLVLGNPKTKGDGMIGQYLITFREAFEAALIIIIVLAYLKRTNKVHYSKYIWLGVIIALSVSLVLGILIWLLYGGISDSAKKLFEGLAALIAVIVLTTMILWMATKGKKIKGEVENRLDSITSGGIVLGLVLFSFIAVFREGLETVLFLTPFLVEDASATVLGAILGIITSLTISYLIFAFGMKINLRRFFYLTSILLVLLAAGLIGYGVHELIEYGGGAQLGWFGEYAYNINIPSDHILHHKGAIGSIFAVMFGYTVKAEWGRVIIHLAYLSIFLPLVLWFYENPYLLALEKRIRSLLFPNKTIEKEVKT